MLPIGLRNLSSFSACFMTVLLSLVEQGNKMIEGARNILTYHLVQISLSKTKDRPGT